MGQRDSRLAADHPQFSSSFDSGCSIQAGISKSSNGSIRRSGPFRTDSTTSEDTCLEQSELPHAGSSGSLHIFNRSKKSDKIKPCQRGYRSASANTKVTQKGTISPPKLSMKKTPNISQSAQSIILYCMENARADTASRIVMRMAHKRDDFAQFIQNISQMQWLEIVNSLKDYLNDVVKHIHCADKIREISYQFGINQVPKRSWGFKADFFAVMANALTTECVFLDGAAHQPTEAIEAWAELVELMFSNVRDGYYQQIRFLRKNSHCFSNISQSSDQSIDSSELPTNGSTPSLSLPTAPQRQNSDSGYSFSYSPSQTAPQASTIPPVASPGVVIRF
ncbi:hypothetical protein L596_024775 [Steinernema carpocapsae]|uniref:Globin family profile domain-containing protein n=1 Tax=Steinernema carpocapsae TaxID=34508 RepID=A0A4U5M5Q4_STECR|nr:hypothetical protein L596_024775 [Steinernema carpocapsae]